MNSPIPSQFNRKKFLQNLCSMTISKESKVFFIFSLTRFTFIREPNGKHLNLIKNNNPNIQFIGPYKKFL